MEHFTIFNATEIVSNSINESASTSEGLTQNILLVISKIFEVITSTGMEYGLWKVLVLIFALIGFFSITSSIISTSVRGVKQISYLVFIPVILVVSFFNKKKRKERLKIWNEFKETKKNVKRRDFILWLFFYVIIPLIILFTVIIFFFF